MGATRSQTKSVSPTKNNVIRWEEAHVLEMLAYLDVCWSRDDSGNLFSESVVHYLKRSLGQIFTWKQVDGKVRELWMNGAVKDADVAWDHACIYRLGISNLKYVAENRDRYKIIKRRAQQIRSRNLVLRTDTPRRSFGRKKPVSRKERLQRYRAGSHGSSPSLNFMVTENHSDPSSQKESQDFKVHPTLEAEIPRTPSTIHESVSSLSPPPVHLGLDDKDDPMATEHSVIASSQPYSRCSSLLQFGPFNSESSTQHTSYEECNVPKAYDNQKNEVKSQRCDSCRLLCCNEGLSFMDYERDLMYLREGKQKAEDTVQQLKNKLHATENTHAILERSIDGSIEVTLRQYLIEIQELQATINDKETLLPFTKGAGKDSTTFHRKIVQRHMEQMNSRIEQLMLHPEIVVPCTGFSLDGQDQGLCTLLMRVIGTCEVHKGSVPFHSLLQSILSAAVCEWVFESEFDEWHFRSTPLLEIILSHLLTQDGDDVVRNLHFAASNTLLQSDYFQEEVIPRRALAFAGRLMATIEPLFPLQKSFEQWGTDLPSFLEGQHLRITDIFTEALRVKVRTLVSTDLFEVSFPGVGTDFDHRTMTSKEHATGRSTTIAQHGETVSKVKMCLTPGLRRFKSERLRADQNSFCKPGVIVENIYDPITLPVVITD